MNIKLMPAPCVWSRGGLFRKKGALKKEKGGLKKIRKPPFSILASCGSLGRSDRWTNKCRRMLARLFNNHYKSKKKL